MKRVFVTASLLTVSASAWATPPDASRQDELRHMVRQDCGSCHGLHLTGGLGSPITAQALKGRDAGNLSEVILDGMPGTAMPGWRLLLSEGEARWIAEYLLREEVTQ